MAVEADQHDSASLAGLRDKRQREPGEAAQVLARARTRADYRVPRGATQRTGCPVISAIVS